MSTAMVLRTTTGAGAPPPGVDPVQDAIGHTSDIRIVLDLLASGQAPSAQQINLAESALSGLENDLLQVQLNGYAGSKTTQPTTPGPGLWVSGAATAAIAAGTGLVGGALGFLLGRRE